MITEPIMGRRPGITGPYRRPSRVITFARRCYSLIICLSQTAGHKKRVAAIKANRRLADLRGY